MTTPSTTGASAARRRGSKRAMSAFTLPEIMIVSSIFALFIAGLVSCQLFGLKIYRISETKMGAADGARKALNEVRERIREGKILTIGRGDDLGFTSIADNQPQVGNALQIHATTNRATYIRFYVDTNDCMLKSVTSFDPTPHVVARFVTNDLAFQSEDFQGQVLTNSDNNRVIRMMLEFYRWEFPVAGNGQGAMYDYYRVQTRVTRRLIE